MKTIIVLGMHRSFTSGVAKGLNSIGVNMGETLLGPGHGNEYGHYEDIDFIHLNDRILDSAGGSWHNPPEREQITLAAAGYQAEIVDLIERKQPADHNGDTLWGWKDPRTTLTLHAYMPHVKNPILVPCFRDPEQVAISLNKRDGMPMMKGVWLAREYNKRLIETLMEFGLRTYD